MVREQRGKERREGRVGAAASLAALVVISGLAIVVVTSDGRQPTCTILFSLPFTLPSAGFFARFQQHTDESTDCLIKVPDQLG